MKQILKLLKLRFVKESVIISVFALIAAMTANIVSPARIDWVGSWEQETGGKAEETEIIGMDEALRLFRNESAVFVDARSIEWYEEGRIPGAVSFPARESEEKFFHIMDSISPEKTIITYCTGPGCSDSHTVADIFRMFGYEKVKIFEDGYPAWEESGKPVERG